ncbi:MAG TPA: protein kinase, partial [Anaerolineae bacterium]
MSITPGENIGAYRVIEQLGSGGMATVFKAYQAALDRYVAVKILHPAFKADPQFFERFKREAQIVAKLEHSNIIPVYDFDEYKSEPYLVMRYIQGDTLKPHIKDKPMPAGEILRLMRPVCQALSYAHKQGVLHRDIKPSNIMVTNDGNIFLTDFGLARMVQAGESTLSQDMMLGTPQYISPEQAQGISDLDGRTDIYSLGVVLFEMLTGRVPFKADTPFATIHDHIYSPLPLPSSIDPDIDPEVERMLLKALAKNPDDRFAVADDLLAAMETTLGTQIAAAQVTATSSLGETKIVNKKKQGLPWWVWAGGAAGLLLIVAGILVGLLLLRRANPNRAPEVEPALAQVTSDQPAVDNQSGNQPG